MEVSIQELRTFRGNTNWYEKHGDGYRIVYFYEDGSHYVGASSKTIEGFMMEFVEVEPIESDADVPPFISVDDLLCRYLNDLKDISAVAVYKTDGTCIQKQKRNKKLK